MLHNLNLLVIEFGCYCDISCWEEVHDILGDDVETGHCSWKESSGWKNDSYVYVTNRLKVVLNKSIGMN